MKKIDGMNLDGMNANILLNREAALAITKNLVSSCYPDRIFQVSGMPQDVQSKLKELNAFYKAIWENNVDFIFKYSESPIERIFLNMFNLYCIEARFSPLIFTSPLKSISEETEYTRANFITSVRVWKEFQNMTGLDDEESFFNYIINSDIEKELQEVLFYNIGSIRLIYTYFHVSIQSTIKDFKVHGKYIRPDIFIWIPAKPNFKLIVECDGFQYHSSRQSFTLDRSRDRILQNKGYQILRFSGDEISQNCSEKVEELRDYLLSRDVELFIDEDEIVDPLKNL